MVCKLCAVRRPRRYCPGVGGDICSICCGTERENSVLCPFDCEYLRDARLHEKPQPLDPQKAPNPEIRITDAFLSANDRLVGRVITLLNGCTAMIPGLVDFDVREAFEALVRTYRTLESGLYYETKPANIVAAAVSERVQQGLAEFRKASQERTGMATVRDSDVLGVLVFLQRLEWQLNNGRKRGRAFLDFLRNQAPEGQTPGVHADSPLIVR